LNEITIKTSKRNEFINITDLVGNFLNNNSKKEKGVILIYCPHTTAALTINESADPDVPVDIIKYLSKLIPLSQEFKHSEGNSDAHIKSSLIGQSVFVPFENNSLTLGTWQGIFFCEFDGPRTRKVFISML